MPNVIHPPVAEQVLMNFMVQSCMLSGLNLDYKAITDTMTHKNYHPYAAGHLNIITYAIKLAETYSFPIRTTVDFSNEIQSDKNLYWLKDLHEKLMKPISKAPELRPDLPDIHYPPNECGVYRLFPKFILDGREGHNLNKRDMPEPAKLKTIMHHWHKDLCEFHQSYAKKIDHPHLLKPADIVALSNKANELHLQLICIKPFWKGNGRIARVIHNILRLRWGLAWQTPDGAKRKDYVESIMKYEDSSTWSNFLDKT